MADEIETKITSEGVTIVAGREIRFRVHGELPATATLQFTSGSVRGPVCIYKDGAWRPIKTHGDA